MRKVLLILVCLVLFLSISSGAEAIFNEIGGEMLYWDIRGGTTMYGFYMDLDFDFFPQGLYGAVVEPDLLLSMYGYRYNYYFELIPSEDVSTYITNGFLTVAEGALVRDLTTAYSAGLGLEIEAEQGVKFFTEGVGVIPLFGDLDFATRPAVRFGISLYW